MDSQPGDLTRRLRKWAAGDAATFDTLVSDLYSELSRIAKQRLRGKQQGHTIDPTTLVHDAYLRLRDSVPVEWQNRSHFYAVAATLMRRVLIDYLRSRSAAKRGGKRAGGRIIVSLSDVTQEPGAYQPDLIDVDRALDELLEIDEQQAMVFDMRYFGGLSIQETADALRISSATVKRDHFLARSWIERRLTGADDRDDP